MNRPSRFGTAISTLAIAAVLSGCAAGQQRRSSIFGSKVDYANIGLATRAQAALVGGKTAEAVQLAERAVENTPRDAGFRALLGNSYFASGRFVSAEAAYRDSLSLIAAQPEVIMKLALVQIAQGKNAEAASVLLAAKDVLDPANYGLALALAGRPDDAVTVLNALARTSDADARVRQNLALAYGLSGDWTMARTVAAQDVPPDQLDGRIQQWMAMATPARASDQVAALTGVKPNPADTGMPQQLALHRAPENNQAYAYAVAPQPEQAKPEAQVQQAAIPAAAPPALPEPSAFVAQPAPEPVIEALAPVVAQSAPEPVAEEADPVVAEAVQALIEPAVQPAPQPIEAPVAIEAPVLPAVAPVVPELPTKFEAEPASYVSISDTVRRAAAEVRKPNGRSKSVVQLGAYSSPGRVTAAWNQLTRKYPALAKYAPMRARFDGPKGTVWRLSIKGFDSDRDARERCELLQSRGGSCFVRRVAGDSPVQFASR